MKIKELKLIPPSKQSSAVLIKFMKEHEKGLKAIKTLAEIKENITSAIEQNTLINLDKILQKINEVENAL